MGKVRPSIKRHCLVRKCHVTTLDGLSLADWWCVIKITASHNFRACFELLKCYNSWILYLMIDIVSQLNYLVLNVELCSYMMRMIICQNVKKCDENLYRSFWNSLGFFSLLNWNHIKRKIFSVYQIFSDNGLTL